MAITDIKPVNQKAIPGPICAVCKLTTALPEAEAEALNGLLSDGTVRYTWLSDELRDQGHNLSAFVLSHHARGRCGSGRKLR